jgi:conjugal transfer/type IV secretion protein DotA/TraY
MPRHSTLTLFLSAALILALAAPALAASPFDVSWAALDPGDDWAAQMINDVFPINGSTCTGGTNCTGNAATVVGQIVGQLTGFVLAIAMFFICYQTLTNIHRVAESANILTDAMTSLGVVRIGFAAIMMFPLQSGFSEGQAFVVQASMWGIGMARAVYNNAVQAIGPDAMVIATPMIPGTKGTVVNLIQNELCRSLINQATNTAGTANPAVPIPTPVTTTSTYNGTISWSYTLSAGNQTGSPVCGTVTLVNAVNTAPTIAGVSTDMTTQQQQILTSVLTNDIRPVVESVAANYWQTKNASALTPLKSAYQTATNDYTNQLTTAATNMTQQLRAAVTAQAARNGSVGLIQNENTLSALGWTSAGAYYLEFARINGQTLSMLNGMAVVNTPSFNGLSQSLKTDLAPIFSATTSLLTTLRTYATVTDSIDPPGGNADIFTGATDGTDGASMIEHVFRSLNLTEPVLHIFADNMSPTGNNWADPFGALTALGQALITASVGAMGLAFVANSNTGTAATTVFSLLSGNFAGAATVNILHQVLQAFATPIFLGLLSLLTPGLLIAYVLPMIPWVIWIAGVAGYLILVCEAVIAVPLWMLAHMAFEGHGLHGNAIRGYELLFNVLFRPVLMILGLFLGYFIFTATSWLIRMSFGIAAGFVLENGWIVTNMIGMWVLLSIFVLTHITAAILSFRMIYLVPHHLPALIGFGGHGRVDHDQFSAAAAWVGTQSTLNTIRSGFSPRNISQSQIGNNSGAGSPPKAIAAPRKALTGPNIQNTSGGNMDSTLHASTDVTPPATED